MICKWCGAKIREKDRSCPRCGQELPPLSECGGFYDLVPGARQGAVPPVNPVSPVPPVPPADGPTGHYPPRKKKKNYGTLWLCVWAVLLFAVIALSVKSCSLSHELDALDDRLSKVEKQQKDAEDNEETSEATDGDDTQNESTPTPTDDSTGSDDQTEGEKKDIRLTLKVTDEKGTIEIDEGGEIGESGNWEIDDHSLKYNGEKVFELYFELNDAKYWTSEIKEPQYNLSQFHWQWEGSFADPGTDGLNSICPVSVSECTSGLQCILTWKQDDQNYEVTINFPPAQPEQNNSNPNGLNIK